MLNQLLDELRNADGPRTLADLSDALEVEPSALKGMILYLAQKGRLRDNQAAEAKIMATCDPSRCGHACPGRDKCPYVVEMPPTYSLIVEDAEG
jgi:hypothetical protein